MMNEYWVTTKDPGERTAKVLKAFDQELPFQDLYTRATNAYYANAMCGDSTSSLDFLGEKGEIIHASLNELRTVSKQFISLTGKQRLAFNAMVRQVDGRSLADTRLADALANYIVDEKGIELLQETFIEQAYLYGMGILGCLWRADLGKEVRADVESGRTYRAGDIECFQISLEDIRFFPFRTNTMEEVDAVAFRRPRNKWALAALYPDLAESITSVGANDEGRVDSFSGDDENQDIISVVYFFHRPCAACPEGKMTVFLEDDSDIVLVDSDNPYRCLPIATMIPEPFQAKVIYGYPKILDLLPIQEGLDTVWSAVTTNLAALGIQGILAPEQMGISVKDIGGLNFVLYNAQVQNAKIEPLQLTANSPDSWKYIEASSRMMSDIASLNSTIRGNPPAGVTAAIAISTLSANAMEFLQSFTKSAAAGIEDYMLLCVKVYSIFVTEPREIPVQVSGNAQGQMDFIGGDLLTVHSLRLKQSNPVAQTTAGRMGMAEQFLQAGLIKSPLEYQQILNTGSIEAAMDDGLDEQDLINKENDALRRGSKVDTFEHDMHEAHVMAHRHVLADPELRRKALAVMEDPMKFGGDEAAMAASMVVQSAVNHIADHVKWIQTKQPQAPQMPPPAAPKPPAPQGAPNGNPV